MADFLEMEDGVKIRYEINGSGKPLILIHGWTGGRGNWIRQVPELSKKFMVVTYDHRGHGESDKPEKHLNLNWLARDLRTIIRKLNLEKPVAVGHSMGAAVLFEYVRTYGDGDFSGLCFIDMTPKFLCGGGWNLGVGGGLTCELSLLLLSQLFTDAQENVKESVVMGYHRDKKLEDLDEEEVELLVQMSLNTSLLATTAFFVAMCLGDYRDVLPKISVPVLLAYGGGSQLFPRQRVYEGKHQELETGDFREERPQHTFRGTGKAEQRINGIHSISLKQHFHSSSFSLKCSVAARVIAVDSFRG